MVVSQKFFCKTIFDYDTGVFYFLLPPQAILKTNAFLDLYGDHWFIWIQLIWKISHHIQNSFIGKFQRLVYGVFIIWQRSSRKIQLVIYKGIRSNHFYQQQKKTEEKPVVRLDSTHLENSSLEAVRVSTKLGINEN